MSQGLLFSLLGWPAFKPGGCIFLCLPIKLSYNVGPAGASNFCCGQTEPRKLHTPLTVGSIFIYFYTSNHCLSKHYLFIYFSCYLQWQLFIIYHVFLCMSSVCRLCSIAYWPIPMPVSYWISQFLF